MRLDVDDFYAPVRNVHCPHLGEYDVLKRTVLVSFAIIRILLPCRCTCDIVIVTIRKIIGGIVEIGVAVAEA